MIVKRPRGSVEIQTDNSHHDITSAMEEEIKNQNISRKNVQLPRLDDEGNGMFEKGIEVEMLSIQIHLLSSWEL